MISWLRIVRNVLHNLSWYLSMTLCKYAHESWMLRNNSNLASSSASEAIIHSSSFFPSLRESVCFVTQKWCCILVMGESSSSFCTQRSKEFPDIPAPCSGLALQIVNCHYQLFDNCHNHYLASEETLLWESSLSFIKIIIQIIITNFVHASWKIIRECDA